MKWPILATPSPKKFAATTLAGQIPTKKSSTIRGQRQVNLHIIRRYVPRHRALEFPWPGGGGRRVVVWDFGQQRSPMTPQFVDPITDDMEDSWTLHMSFAMFLRVARGASHVWEEGNTPWRSSDLHETGVRRLETKLAAPELGFGVRQEDFTTLPTKATR